MSDFDLEDLTMRLSVATVHELSSENSVSIVKPVVKRSLRPQNVLKAAVVLVEPVIEVGVSHSKKYCSCCGQKYNSLPVCSCAEYLGATDCDLDCFQITTEFKADAIHKISDSVKLGNGVSSDVAHVLSSFGAAGRINHLNPVKDRLAQQLINEIDRVQAEYRGDGNPIKVGLFVSRPWNLNASSMTKQEILQLSMSCPSLSTYCWRTTFTP